MAIRGILLILFILAFAHIAKTNDALAMTPTVASINY